MSDAAVAHANPAAKGVSLWGGLFGLCVFVATLKTKIDPVVMILAGAVVGGLAFR